MLKEKLSNLAEVYTLEELQDLDIIHKSPLTEFYISRLPEIFIQPKPDAAIWWYEKEKFEINKLCNHGGLASAEMEIPFLALAS